MTYIQCDVLMTYIIYEVFIWRLVFSIEIDNDERGVIGDFTTISDIRITKAKPE